MEEVRKEVKKEWRKEGETGGKGGGRKEGRMEREEKEGREAVRMKAEREGWWEEWTMRNVRKEEGRKKDVVLTCRVSTIHLNRE